MESLGAAVGVAIRTRRTAMGLSQEQLGEIAGLDRTYISGVERGVRNPTLRIIEHLATALGVTTVELFSEADRIQKKERTKF